MKTYDYPTGIELYFSKINRNMFDANSYPIRDRHTSPEPLDEASLVAYAIQGDAEAFGDLYERYMNQIYRYIYYRVSDSGIAEDFTETVFLKVWENLSSFEIDRISFKGWLFRVAHNLLVDYYRTRKKQYSLDENFDLLDPAQSPEEFMITSEQETLVHAALRRIKKEYQDILTLRFINGLSHAEAAKVLDRNIGAVRVLQHRALQALDKELGILIKGLGEVEIG
jgi:RNA polymerase sigma-70 factor (ECF subfamily)